MDKNNYRLWTARNFEVLFPGKLSDKMFKDGQEMKHSPYGLLSDWRCDMESSQCDNVTAALWSEWSAGDLWQGVTVTSAASKSSE